MNPAILAEVSAQSVPIETINTSISTPVKIENVITPTIKKSFSDYFTDETIKLLVVFNTIYIIGHLFEWWS